MNTPTIQEIETATFRKCPYFFSTNTMRAFGQTKRSFTVARTPRGRIFIYAPMHDNEGRAMGYTFREFKDNDLKRVRNDDDTVFIHDSLSDIMDFLRSH